MGLKLLPLLPEGSTYTGIDKGSALIHKAKEAFQHTPYTTEFMIGDLEDVHLERRFDIAMCHAFLLHMPDSRKIVHKMIDSVVDGGKIICFEPHWIANTSNYYLDGIEQSKGVRLGILQKLYEKQHNQSGKDGNIGLKLPIILSQLGVRNVECRVSDKVNFLDQQMEDEWTKERKCDGKSIYI